MGTFIKINNADIEEVLKNVSRQYLVGDLKKPQEIGHIKSEQLEIGITNYSQYTTEDVHYHTKAVEYQYVLAGWTTYMEVETGKVFEFKKGDFYCIEPGTAYAQKSKGGTRILFVKVPSVNDKCLVELSEEIQQWYKEGLVTVRKDYSHCSEMPSPNSVRPAAAVAIVNDNKILMLRRRDNGKWTLPGGTLEMSESLVDCAIREVKEETGLAIEVKDVIGTYTDPDIRIEYSDGEVRREFTVVYYGVNKDINITIDDESSAYEWIEVAKLSEYPMADSQKKRLDDVVEFLHTGRKRMG